MQLSSRFYISAGFVCVGLGLAGIPLPLLPTTPFLLLAAYCFSRGSDRWHNWLMTHPTLSPYILAFRDKGGLTRQQKLRIAGLVTITLVVSGFFAPFLFAKILAVVIWIVTMCFLYFKETAPSE